MKTKVAKVRSVPSEILHQFIIDCPPPDAPNVKELEQQTDTHWNTIYKVLRGELRFVMEIEEFPDFYRKFGKPLELLRWLVRQCEPEYRLFHIADESKLNGALNDENDQIVIKTADAIKGTIEALKDGRWSDMEIKAQEDIYLEIISEASSALKELDRIRKQGSRSHKKEGVVTR